MSSNQRPTLKRWLTIVGIGEDGAAGLSDEAKRLIGEAEIVFGGKRHLALAKTSIKGEGRTWPSPFDAAMRDVVALRGSKVCVLASGDPFLHGVGATLARHVPVDEMLVVPAPSAFSLAAARLGWALQDVETVSLHGHAIDLIRPLLQPKRRVLALTSDRDGPKTVADLLKRLGFGGSTLTVLEALGGPDERVRRTTAQAFDVKDVNALNVLAVEIESSREARVLPLAPGRADDLFEHDGQITKREVRAVTLAALAPRRGELLWDIGAGSGSISIEWMLADPSMRAVAVEANAERAARVRRNASAFGVPGLTVVEGAAPSALAGLPAPDAIFIGGGGTDDGVLDTAVGALPSGGRLVANAVTLEMEVLLLARHAALGGDLVRIAISRETAIGSMKGWRPAMPVTQWCWVKPGGEAVIVAGIGSKKGVSAAEVVAAVEAALKEHGLTRPALSMLATGRMKQDEAGIIAAGGTLNVPLILVDSEVLQEMSDRTLSHSDASLSAAGTPSVSEAAALAAAGEGARLAGPRIAVGRVTCAIAFGEDR